MKNRNLKIREHVVICFAALVMLCGYLFLGILPLRRVARSLHRETVNREAHISKASQVSSQLNPMRQQLEYLAAYVGDYHRRIPDERQVGEFLQQIAELMKAHGLSNQVVRPGAENPGEKLNTIPITMECNGDLDQIFDFFGSLKEIDRVIRIAKVELSSDELTESMAKMWAQANIYYEAK